MAEKIKYSNDINNLTDQQQGIQDLIRKEAESQSIDPDLAHVVGWMENRYRPEGNSSAGAIGPMQIMPATAKAYGVSIEDLKNPATNIKLGVQILKDNLDKYNGNVKAALVAYNGTPTRAQIYLRNNEDPSVLKPETQNYLKQAEALYPNINESHNMSEKSNNPFDYSMDGESKENNDTGVFGETEALPDHIKNWDPKVFNKDNRSLKEKAVEYLLSHPEVPLAGVTDAYLQKKVNESLNQVKPNIEATESSGDRWNRKVVGSLGPGADSSTEAAKNYNLQEDLNKQGQGHQWKVNREGIIRDPLELERERRIKLEMDKESPVQRVLRSGKEALKVPEHIGAFGKAKFLGPLSSGFSAANAVRANERADELEASGDTIGAAIARANAVSSGFASIPASPYAPLDVVKGIGTIGEIGLTGAEQLKDLLFPKESVVKKRPAELKKADGGVIPLSLRHVYFHRKKRNG